VFTQNILHSPLLHRKAPAMHLFGGNMHLKHENTLLWDGIFHHGDEKFHHLNTILLVEDENFHL